ncbi:hypothetical protein KC614_02100 [candidate division WWE3 bacterium]|uniref:Uncharacterized protein n=1 Tax=candidate division WWE3 bacterium TaxID=2053526 RepID=A0A955RQZ9_UNCKA|nr:hypothetical protein [candidate division WWE3 bacterium]
MKKRLLVFVIILLCVFAVGSYLVFFSPTPDNKANYPQPTLPYATIVESAHITEDCELSVTNDYGDITLTLDYAETVADKSTCVSKIEVEISPSQHYLLFSDYDGDTPVLKLFNQEYNRTVKLESYVGMVIRDAKFTPDNIAVATVSVDNQTSQQYLYVYNTPVMFVNSQFYINDQNELTDNLVYVRKELKLPNQGKYYGDISHDDTQLYIHPLGFPDFPPIYSIYFDTL